MRQGEIRVPFTAQQATLGGSRSRMEKLAPPLLLGFNSTN
jgi:hypothetical protein